MKILRPALVVALGLVALSCTQLFSKLDNPADGKAVNYQGYPTVSDPGAINPGKPSSSSPSLFAPKLVATKVSGAERYHFQVASSKDFSPASIAHQNDAATSNEYLPVAWSGYDTSAAYYWRVRAYKDGAWGPWSTQLATFSFTSPNAGSTIPVDASAVNSPTPTFDWSDMEGAIGYRIQVSALADFSIIADHSETLTESAYVLGSNLANSTTWYWRVAAKGVDGSWSAYAPTLSFSTLFPAALAPKILPAAGSYSSDQSVTISCETKDAVIHYTTDGSAPSAESAVYSEAIAVAGHGTKTTIKAIAIAPGKTASGVSSGTWAISYLVPSLTLPNNAATLLDATPDFSWAAVTGASGYRFQLSLNSDFSSTVTDNSALTTASYTQATELVNNTRYYWRVAQKNVDGLWGAFSPARSFTLNISTSLGITPDMASPLSVSFSGGTNSISSGQTITISATVSPTPDSYAWYLDGKLQSASTASSITIVADNLIPGYHSLSLRATKGSGKGNASIQFLKVDTSDSVSSSRPIGTGSLPLAFATISWRAL
jgi:hypothetical protein